MDSPRKRQRHKIGDVFAVPLVDGSFSLGQVLSYEPDALNSVGCAFYSIRALDPKSLVVPQPLSREDIVSILLTTKDLLNRGRWPVLANRAAPIPLAHCPYDRFRSLKWVGATIEGSAIVEQFLSAYHGLSPWDQFADPKYLDELLLDAALRPPNVLLSMNGRGDS